MRELWQLFWLFMRVGALTFGGGYAMLPILQKEVVRDKQWATDEQVLDYYAIAQSAPGVIAVNAAIFIGYDRRGRIGAIVAAIGVALPSIIVISAIAKFLTLMGDAPIFKHAFAGVRVAVVALIVSTVAAMWRAFIKSWVEVGLFIAALMAMLLFQVSPIIIVLVTAALGVLRSKVIVSREIPGSQWERGKR